MRTRRRLARSAGTRTRWAFLGHVHVAGSGSGDRPRVEHAGGSRQRAERQPAWADHGQTDGTGQNGSDAVKTFVDARIHITPTQTNRVGQPHTFTAFVEKNLGLGGGWVAAGSEPVTITLTNRTVRTATPAGRSAVIRTRVGHFSATFTRRTRVR